MKLYNKYTVTKNDGPTDPDAVYFVLRIDTDPAARMALQAYANVISDQEFAAQLRDLVERFRYSGMQQEDLE